MLLAVTRTPLPWEERFGAVTRRRLGGWHVLAVSSDHLTRISEGPEGLRLTTTLGELLPLAFDRRTLGR